MMQRLHTDTLHRLNSDVITPCYDRTGLKPGIVHIGLGAFHRAHQAVYTEDAISRCGGDWGIIGVSLRSQTVASLLDPQAGLYSILAQDAKHSQLRVVGCILDVLFAPENPDRVADAIADSAIRLLTLTITEKGYCLAEDGLSLNHDDALIAADLLNPCQPSSAIGLIAYGLHKRLKNGGEPLTVLSCDNLSENSQRLKGVLTEYLQQNFTEVIPWLEENVSFPCSMVDRIVPGSTSEQTIAQSNLLGLIDEAAISTECFKQWIVEDKFAAERPAWDQVGVEFVENIQPFENMKLRVLNASHSAIAFSGLLADLDTVDQVMADQQLADYMTTLIDSELIPGIVAPNGFDLNDYRNQLLQRFQNPHLLHRCQQIAMDSSEKISQRWLPAFQSSNSTEYLTMALSLWCFFVLCTDFKIDDPKSDQLMALRSSSDSMTKRLENALSIARFNSDNISDLETLNTQVCSNIDILMRGGIRELLRQ